MHFLAIFLGEVFLRHLKGFIDALTDGDARHHDYEFAPAVVLIQLEHCLYVSIGFSDAGFHLYREVVFTGLRRLQPRRRLYLIRALDFVDAFQNNRIG